MRYDLRSPAGIPFLGRGIYYGIFGYGGMLGRESIVNKEIKYYKELRKKRPLNPPESTNLGVYMAEKREIDAAKREGSKSLWGELGLTDGVKSDAGF